MNQPRRKYLVPIILVLLFAAPGLAAIFFFQHPEWLSEAKINRGALLNPPILLEKNKSDDKWVLLYWSPSDCDETCMKHLDKLARIRLALGRRLYNVDAKLLLGKSARPVSAAFKSRLKDQDIKVETFTETEEILVSKLPNQSSIYIENPKGFLVMTYPSDVIPKDIHHDLKRFLNIKEQ
jgi:hypothetical protein